jgi:hypothetical protein
MQLRNFKRQWLMPGSRRALGRDPLHGGAVLLTYLRFRFLHLPHRYQPYLFRPSKPRLGPWQ